MFVTEVLNRFQCQQWPSQMLRETTAVGPALVGLGQPGRPPQTAPAASPARTAEKSVAML